MKHYIKDSKYFIEDDLGKIVLTIELCDKIDGNQIILETKNDRYCGPIELIFK